MKTLGHGQLTDLQDRGYLLRGHDDPQLRGGFDEAVRSVVQHPPPVEELTLAIERLRDGDEGRWIGGAQIWSGPAWAPAEELQHEWDISRAGRYSIRSRGFAEFLLGSLGRLTTNELVGRGVATHVPGDFAVAAGDGHHRLLAMCAYGIPSIPVVLHVYEPPAQVWPPPPTRDELLRQRHARLPR